MPGRIEFELADLDDLTVGMAWRDLEGKCRAEDGRLAGQAERGGAAEAGVQEAISTDGRDLPAASTVGRRLGQSPAEPGVFSASPDRTPGSGAV